MEENPTKDADSVIQILESADKEIEDLREEFSFAKEEYVPVIVTEKLQRNEANAGGLWTPWKKEIQIMCFDVITHEYVHYMYSELTSYDETNRDGWETEAMAFYFTAQHSVEKRMYLAKKYPDTMDNIEVLIGKKYETVEDELLFLNLALSMDTGNLYNYLDVSGGIAFCDFVCNTYGKENMISCLLFPDKTRTYVGEDMDSLLAEWQEYLENFEHTIIIEVLGGLTP